MTVGAAWSRVALRLADLGVSDAEMEAELLVREGLGAGRSRFFASLSDALTPAQAMEVERLVGRRLTGEPLPYILGRREFYGLEFVVSPSVLVPRPETELLVDLVVGHVRGRRAAALEVADVGTGCGAIAVAVAVILPRCHVWAIDISPEALEVADINRRRHGVADRVHLAQGDLLGPLRGAVDVVVSNPPYIPTAALASLASEVRREPRPALDGGADGLAVTTRLLAQAARRVRPGGRVFVEVSPEQSGPVCRLAEARFPGARATAVRDLQGLDRVVAVSVPGRRDAATDA